MATTVPSAHGSVSTRDATMTMRDGRASVYCKRQTDLHQRTTITAVTRRRGPGRRKLPETFAHRARYRGARTDSRRTADRRENVPRSNTDCGPLYKYTSLGALNDREQWRPVREDFETESPHTKYLLAINKNS